MPASRIATPQTSSHRTSFHSNKWSHQGPYNALMQDRISNLNFLELARSRTKTLDLSVKSNEGIKNLTSFFYSYLRRVAPISGSRLWWTGDIWFLCLRVNCANRLFMSISLPEVSQSIFYSFCIFWLKLVNLRQNAPLCLGFLRRSTELSP
jgi:hypothetical protein